MDQTVPGNGAAGTDDARGLEEPFTVVLPSRRHAQLLTQLIAAELDDYAYAANARHRHRPDGDDVRELASELGEVRDSLLDQLAQTDQTGQTGQPRG